MRFLLYIRQSITADRDESLSLAFQERSLRELVRREGGVVIEPPIIDADEKGWDPHRPGITSLIERTRDQRPDAVAVYAMSRFARDNWLAEGIWRQLIQTQPGLQFKSVTEPHAHDDMVRGILGVISQAERKRMGAFLSSAFRERARRGKPHGRVPFGFTKGEDGRLVPVPDQRHWILQVIERYEAGWSLRRLAIWLQEQAEWERVWEPNTIRNIIIQPANAGAIKCADVLEWECHEPIITRERHERLVAQYQSGHYVRTKRNYSWLERLMICGCGAPLLLRGQMKIKREYGQFVCAAVAYHELPNRPNPWTKCQSRPRSITVGKAERLVAELLAAALESIPDWRDVERRTLDAFYRDQPDVIERRRRLERTAANLERERDRLLVLYRRASLDVERWEREDAALSARIESARGELAAIPAAPSPDALRTAAATLTDIGDRFRLAAAISPDEVAGIMRTAGIRGQLDNGSVRLIWPDDLAPFFN